MSRKSADVALLNQLPVNADKQLADVPWTT